MLVETNCDTPEDVTNGEIKDDKIKLVVLKTENTVRPTSGVLLGIQGDCEGTSSRKLYNVTILRRYSLKGDKISGLQDHDLLLELQVNGSARIGLKSRRGFSKVLDGLINCDFTISAPREAKCCQSWVDNICHPDDALEKLTFKKLTTIRNMHGILHGLKRIQCLVCHQ